MSTKPVDPSSTFPAGQRRYHRLTQDTPEVFKINAVYVGVAILCGFVWALFVAATFIALTGGV